MITSLHLLSGQSHSSTVLKKSCFVSLLGVVLLFSGCVHQSRETSSQGEGPSKVAILNPPQAQVTDDSLLLFEEGFESGVYSFKNSGNAPEVVEAKDARAGNYVLKSQITPARENKYRTETSLNVDGLNFDVGQEYWVGMSIKLGSDYDDGVDFNDQGMLMQWHYRDWNYPNVRDAQPLLLRYVGNGKGIVDSEVLGKEGTADRTLAEFDVPIGEWMDWVFHYKIDGKDGIIRIWCDGELVVDWSGDNHQVEKHDGAYLKFGLYSAQFNPKKSWSSPMPEGASRTVYHDEIRIAGADGSYELVAPGSAMKQ